VVRALLLPLAVFAAALPGCGSGAAATNDNGGLPALTGRVVDGADLLPAPEEARLAAQLAALEKSTGDQLVVVTVPSLEGEPIEKFGLRLGRGWKIGQKGLNNGVLLIVAPNDRQVRIEVGYGLEGLLTDGRAKAIIDTRLLPRFRHGDFSEAIAAGTRSISALLESDRRRPRPLPVKKAA
jgi:uncharacterized protein